MKEVSYQKIQTPGRNLSAYHVAVDLFYFENGLLFYIKLVEMNLLQLMIMISNIKLFKLFF